MPVENCLYFLLQLLELITLACESTQHIWSVLEAPTASGRISPSGGKMELLR